MSLCGMLAFNALEAAIYAVYVKNTAGGCIVIYFRSLERFCGGGGYGQKNRRRNRGAHGKT